MINGCPRVHHAPDAGGVLIYDMRAGVSGGNAVTRFRCKIPDPRVWVKFGALWVPQDGSTAPGAATLTIWISALQRRADSTGFPVEDLVGTSAAPLSIPTNTALFGKFVNVQTAYSELQAVMNIVTPTAGVQGSWYAQASYYPTVDMSRDEWEALVGLAALNTEGVQRLSV